MPINLIICKSYIIIHEYVSMDPFTYWKLSHTNYLQKLQNTYLSTNILESNMHHNMIILAGIHNNDVYIYYK